MLLLDLARSRSAQLCFSWASLFPAVAAGCLIAFYLALRIA
jgi:hypothetical protein